MNRRGLALLVVVLLVVLGGCSGFDSRDAATPTGPSVPDEPDGTQVPDDPGDVTGGTLGGGANETLEPETGITATVVEVVDGDTIEVRYPNGTTDTVRLLGVDTPEVHVDNQPAEFEGVPETSGGEACLRDAGQNASAFARQTLADEQVTLVVDPTADRRGRYGRLLAYVHVDGTDFNYRLVAEGHARVYDSTFERSDRYYAAESEAQTSRNALWTCRTPGTADEADPSDSVSDSATDGETAVASPALVLQTVHADAQGNDHENLNDEYVVFRNDGDDPLALGGWTVSDEADYTYVFPEGFVLAPGEAVTLRTGTGEDTDETLYWGRDSAVWNNGGDTVTVVRDGETVLEYSYGS